MVDTTNCIVLYRFIRAKKERDGDVYSHKIIQITLEVSDKSN
jgi:hypothetical protein